MVTPHAANGNGNGGARWWVTWLPIVAAGVVVCSAIITPLFQQGSQEGSQATTIANLLSRVADLERRVNKQDEALETAQLQQGSDCEEFAKIETQFGTVETVMNQTHVDDLRTRGLLWPEVFKQVYPTTFYEIKIPHEVAPCTR
jgi:hypothetical protein